MSSSPSKKTQVEEQKIIKENIAEEYKNNETDEIEELNMIVEKSQKDKLEEKRKKEEEEERKKEEESKKEENVKKKN